MKRWHVLVALFLLVGFGSVGVSYAQKPKFQKTWKIYFSTMIYQNNWQGKIIEKWAREIEDRTNGGLKLELVGMPEVQV